MRGGPKDPLAIINQLDDSIACSPWKFLLINVTSLALPANVNAIRENR